MKKITAFIFLAALFITRIHAQTITCGQVAAFVGSSVTICAPIKGMEVDSANKALPMLLFLCAPFPHQSVIIVIRQSVMSKFYSQPATWMNKNVCVTGTIGVYKGRNIIEVKNKTQIIGVH